jgi:hypothetical protein
VLVRCGRVDPVPDALAFTRREQRISMCDIVGSWTQAGAISSITPP